jgi:hypothetical protein
MADEFTAPVRISDRPTESARRCAEPTLFRGNDSAYDVPPSATNTAIVAMTFA